MGKKSRNPDQIWADMKLLLRGRHARLVMQATVPTSEGSEGKEEKESTLYQFELTPDGFKIQKKSKVLLTVIKGDFDEKIFTKDDQPIDLTVIPTVRQWLQTIIKNVRNKDSKVKFEDLK